MDSEMQRSLSPLASPDTEDLPSFSSGSSSEDDDPRSAATKPWHSDPLPEASVPDESLKRSRSNSVPDIYKFFKLEENEQNENRTVSACIHDQKEIAFSFRAVGDLFNHKPALEKLQQEDESFKADVSIFKKVVDTCIHVADWLDDCGGNMCEKLSAREDMARALLQLEKMADSFGLLPILRVVFQNLDVNPKLYGADKHKIETDLKEADEHCKAFHGYADRGCEAVRRYIETLDPTKPQTAELVCQRGFIRHQFNSEMERARIEVKACRGRLDDVRDTILRLRRHISAIRWTHRILRYGAAGVVFSMMVKQYRAGDISGYTAAGGMGLTVLAMLAVAPKHATELHIALAMCWTEYERMEKQLKQVESKLEMNMKEMRRQVEQQQQQQQQQQRV